MRAVHLGDGASPPADNMGGSATSQTRGQVFLPTQARALLLKLLKMVTKVGLTLAKLWVVNVGAFAILKIGDERITSTVLKVRNFTKISPH